MEIIALIFIIWLIGCAFPGSGGGSGGIELGVVFAFIVGAALFYLWAWAWVAAGIYTYAWTGSGWLGFIAGSFVFVSPWLIGGTCAHFSNRKQADSLSRKEG